MLSGNCSPDYSIRMSFAGLKDSIKKIIPRLQPGKFRSRQEDALTSKTHKILLKNLTGYRKDRGFKREKLKGVQGGIPNSGTLENSHPYPRENLYSTWQGLTSPTNLYVIKR